MSKSILTAIFLIQLSVVSYSQEDSSWLVRMDSVVISDNRLSGTYAEAPRDVCVLGRKDLASLPALSIPEILQGISGVDIRQRGPLGVQADVGIRGGTFEQTLVMVNGIKMNDPQTGHHTMNLPFGLSDLEQVEIIKGPSAMQYGQDAFTGAINFVTHIPDTKNIRAKLFGGSFGLRGGSLSVSLPYRNFRQSLSISDERADGYRPNTDFSLYRGFYESAIPAGKGEFHMMGGYVGRKFGANGFYADPSYTGQFEEVRTGLAAISYENKTGKISWHPRIYYRINRDDYFFIRDQPSVYENLHTTDVAGADLNASWKNSLGMTGLGFETRLESIHGTWTRNGEHSLSNLNGYQRKEAGVFAEHRFNVGRFEATPGLYAGYYSDFGWNAFPGLDIGYTLSKRFRFYATAGRSFRVPDFYDMYYDSPVEKGSRDLVPERATGYEAGIKYFSSVVSGGVNIFRQTSRNLIDWVQVPATDSTYYWQAKNVTRLARTGFEIGMNFDFSRLAGPAPWVRKIGLSYNYLLSDLGNSGYISRYVLDNLKDQFVAGINHRIAWEIFHDFNIQYNRREGIRGYWVLDSRIYWDHGGKPLIFAEATNWTGTRYTEVMVPMPGRWIRAGIEYNFGL